MNDVQRLLVTRNAVLTAVLIRWIVRCLKGLKLAGARQSIPKPTTWKW
jgi:hypothetical protein